MIASVLRKLVIIGVVAPRGVFCCGGQVEALKDSMIVVYNKPHTA